MGFSGRVVRPVPGGRGGDAALRPLVGAGRLSLPGAYMITEQEWWRRKVAPTGGRHVGNDGRRFRADADQQGGGGQGRGPGLRVCGPG
jgi:hypothetical protein